VDLCNGRIDADNRRSILVEYEFFTQPSDGSGSIDRDEFLNIPQIASNPLASRMIAIFDSESVSPLHLDLNDRI
jgi:Ca2+-binding EF-hand superfamily protein